MTGKNKEKITVITAGGRGRRMGKQTPKQFSLLDNLPVLMHSLHRFKCYDENMRIIVSLPPDSCDYWHNLCKTHNFTIAHDLAAGGDTRFASVKNALAYVPYDAFVAVHDGVRPLVTRETLEAAFSSAEKNGAAVPTVPLSFSLRKLEGDKSRAADRSQYREVQTPQVFRSELLKKAYNADFQEGFTDDASVLEADGRSPVLTPGNRENIKITYPSDMVIAEALLKSCPEKFKYFQT